MSAGGRPLLEVERLAVKYGEFSALRNVSLSIDAGEILAVLGANGAGKSSLARAISRLIGSSEGSLTFEGENLLKRKPHAVRRMGLVYLPEGRGVFPTLSVQDNLKMSVRFLNDRSLRHEGIEKAYRLFPVLEERKGQLASSLSGGEQQMLSLARALAISPKIIIADEMSLGLAPLMVDLVFEQLARIQKEGVGIIVIEQFVHRALAVADRALVLQRGEVAWYGRARDGDPQVIMDKYVGVN